MKKLLTIVIIFIGVIVYAQQAKKYTVSLTIEQWQYVVNSIDSKAASKLLEDQLIPQLQKDSVNKKP